MQDDYNGNWRKLVDVNRASLVVSSEEQLVALAEKMANANELRAMSPAAAEVRPAVLQLKNRFKHALFNGYRDALYSVQLVLPRSSLVGGCRRELGRLLFCTVAAFPSNFKDATRAGAAPCAQRRATY